MLVEGRGKIPPSHEVVLLSESDVAFVRQAATDRNTYRRYEQRADQWGRGIVSDPAFVGMLGEHALCVWLNRRAGCRLQLDTELRARGDRGIDLATDGIGIEVKTRQPTSKSNLFRRIDGRKRLLPLRSEVCVFARRVHDREVHLLGWIMSLDMIRISHLERGRGDWWNLRTEDVDLQPMSRLVSEIELARSL